MSDQARWFDQYLKQVQDYLFLLFRQLSSQNLSVFDPESEDLDDPVLDVCFLLGVEELQKELLDDRSGRSGDAKLEGASCGVGGLNIWGFIPISLMWGLGSTGGV